MLQKIVAEEQEANFISRLHGGKLDIIPWPVIESKEIYKLFAILKRRLDLQKVSHPTAGEFLLTIKTLMAKIKVFFSFFRSHDIILSMYLQANDWVEISRLSLTIYCLLFGPFILTTENMAEHRAKSLALILPIALATGFSEIEPQLEPLKVP